ncbi:phosphotransferase family protein [Mycobacterium sp. pW049]|uniref:phosphotransferase family protein n=1 Tax=[Mycobacterium] bulgaricum TaxID=3238985 RepID=UPI00351B9994
MPDLDVVERRRGGLEKWLTAALPGDASVSLTPFMPASSGFSNVTLLTEMRITDAQGTVSRDVVLRAQSTDGGLFPDYDLRLQYDVMAALVPTEVPVPDVLWFIDDPEVLGAPCYLMEHVKGEVASGFRPGFHGHGLFFDATVARRQAMWFAAIDVMAALHRVPVAGLALPTSLNPHLTGEAALHGLLDAIETQLSRARVEVPLLHEAVRKLRGSVPQNVPVALCWGDARPGNIIYRDDEVVATLDWELAYVGPPEGDLAYFLLVDEVVAELNDVPRLPGLPDSESTIAHYEQKLGRPVSDLAFHTVLQALRMATMLALTVALSPSQLTFPPNYLTDNVAMRRLSALMD